MAADLRALVAPSFDAPMLIVTARADDERSGCLVGFHTQVSITPWRFAVVISRENHTHGVAVRATHLGVHLLGAGDEALARLFGGTTADDHVDKFASGGWTDSDLGPPVLEAVPAWFVGAVVGRFDGGDHEGFVLEPVASGPDGARRLAPDALLRYSRVADLKPGHEA